VGVLVSSLKDSLRCARCVPLAMRPSNNRESLLPSAPFLPVNHSTVDGVVIAFRRANAARRRLNRAAVVNESDCNAGALVPPASAKQVYWAGPAERVLV